ncbi:MAG: hypothetical protein ACKVG6_18430 [Alphaproteobacteria bacterium]
MAFAVVVVVGVAQDAAILKKFDGNFTLAEAADEFRLGRMGDQKSQQRLAFRRDVVLLVHRILFKPPYEPAAGVGPGNLAVCIRPTYSVGVRGLRSLLGSWSGPIGASDWR